AIAIALPHAGINRMLSVLAPITSVIIITFALTPRGERRRMWRDIGLGRSGRSVWLIALVVPMLLLAMAYGTALVLGVAELKPLDRRPGGCHHDCRRRRLLRLSLGPFGERLAGGHRAQRRQHDVHHRCRRRHRAVAGRLGVRGRRVRARNPGQRGDYRWNPLG